MALEIRKSMDISDFQENWEHIKALVRSEYEAVKGYEGGYNLCLGLTWDVWDCDESGEEEEFPRDYKEVEGLGNVSGM